MKSSELIKRLQELIDEYGDHDIEIEGIDMDDLYIIKPCNDYPYSLLTCKNMVYDG